jgi:hypothetical protein
MQSWSLCAKCEEQTGQGASCYIRRVYCVTANPVPVIVLIVIVIQCHLWRLHRPTKDNSQIEYKLRIAGQGPTDLAMASFLNNFQFSSSRYKFAGRIIGHPDAIHTLALTKKGTYLASGSKSSRDIEPLLS